MRAISKRPWCSLKQRPTPRSHLPLMRLSPLTRFGTTFRVPAKLNAPFPDNPQGMTEAALPQLIEGLTRDSAEVSGHIVVDNAETRYKITNGHCQQLSPGLASHKIRGQVYLQTVGDEATLDALVLQHLATLNLTSQEAGW